MWLGILLAYDSYDWPPPHHGWPVSFFVVALVLLAYLLVVADHRQRCAGATEAHVLRLHGQRVDRRRRSSPLSRGAVGFFVVLRGSAFAAHAVPNGSFAGAAGAV